MAYMTIAYDGNFNTDIRTRMIGGPVEIWIKIHLNLNPKFLHIILRVDKRE
jgi:hypothetical protein